MNKSIFYIIAFFTFFPLLVLAQNQESDYQRETMVGIKGGYNYSSAYLHHDIFRYPAEIGGTSGYNAGIIFQSFYERNWKGKAGFQAELNFTKKGYKQHFQDTVVTEDNIDLIEGGTLGDPLYRESYVASFDYLELPVLVVVRLGGEKFKVFLQAGAYVEYLLKYQGENQPDFVMVGDNFTGEAWHEYDASRDPKVGYGYKGGAGLSYKFPFGTFMVESVFSYSLSNFMDPVTFDSGIPNWSNHMVFGINFGYVVTFGEIK